MKKLLYNLSYRFKWMKIYFSPFKFIFPRLYIGTIAIGTPYFFPRRWVKATPELAHKATLDYIKDTEDFNKRNPQYPRKLKSYEEIYKDKLKLSYPIPKKIGWDFVPMGWKTKWTRIDYRHEYNPIWSFVFFKWQITLIFSPEHYTHYWECWLYYSNNTDKNKNVKERIEQARKEFPCIWTTYTDDNRKTNICYWDVILKNKWI